MSNLILGFFVFVVTFGLIYAGFSLRDARFRRGLSASPRERLAAARARQRAPQRRIVRMSDESRVKARQWLAQRAHEADQGRRLH